MNNDWLKGMEDKAAGAIKSEAGKVTGDAKLRAEGELDKVKGDIEKAAGDAEDRINRQ